MSQPKQSGEWLESDGRGGFSTGTFSFLAERTYHALFTVPTPAGRFQLLKFLQLRFTSTDKSIQTEDLLPWNFFPEVTTGGGAHFSFIRKSLWPRWRIALSPKASLELELLMSFGTSALVIRATLWGTSGTLQARPFFSFMPFHHNLLAEQGDAPHCVTHEKKGITTLTVGQEKRCSEKCVLRFPGSFIADAQWYYNFKYRAELERGYAGREDLWSPGTFTLALQEGKKVHLSEVFAASQSSRCTSAFFEKVFDLETRRRSAGRVSVNRDLFYTDYSSSEEQKKSNAAPSLLAGYPWFESWGRDTFIALRGFYWSDGHHREALPIITHWLSYLSEGMIPNRILEGGKSEYNSIDATLWFAHCCLELLNQKSIKAKEAKELKSALWSIVNAYARGTRYNIHLDGDGLIFGGAVGVQLTWMDAKIGSEVVTPRSGKAVEVQALWLSLLKGLSSHFAGSDQKRLSDMYDHGAHAFLQKFWSDQKQYLYDVIDVEGKSGVVDDSLRPNQILAVGGTPIMHLPLAKAQKVVAVVRAQLATPFGLRTLDRSDPRYQPRYGGSVEKRDRAYHQGTVWPYLLGSFIQAIVRTDPEVSSKILYRQYLQPLVREAKLFGKVMAVSELYDADPPQHKKGAPFQAWSTAELLFALSVLQQQKKLDR